MPLTAGARLGPYDIVSLIGAGGMGEVYRARDTRLARDVALKVLPESFSADADRLRRFEQETCAAGALNHPNVLVVHDFGSHGGGPFLVSELLEGATLREQLSGHRCRCGRRLTTRSRSPPGSRPRTSAGSSIAISSRKICS
jgi:serine/threonine protein kinase